MLARLNFLLGFGLLVLLGFYFAFVWAILPVLSRLAPGWVPAAAALAVLASVGLTVQALATAIGTLAGVASWTRGANATAVVSQAAMVAGHGMLVYAGLPWLSGGMPPSQAVLAATAALYAAGVTAGVLEWRARRRT